MRALSPVTGRADRAASIAFLIAALSACIAACGSSGGARRSSSSQSDPLLARSQCMRAHGVKNFPDPVRVNGSEGFPDTIGRPGMASVSIEGIVFSGPAFDAAAKACAGGGAADHGPRLTQARKDAFIAQARCIRDHGVARFPDPTFGPAGWGIRSDLGPGENPDSPAMRAAEQACANVGAPLPGV